MEPIKKFIDCLIPTNACNFRCKYCYIGQKNTFQQKPVALSKTPEMIRRAMSQQRLGGVCLINICAYGETMLTPNISNIVKELLEEGHYVMIVTNGVISKSFKELSDFPEELRSKLFIKFSFHYDELKKRNLLAQYSNNVALMKNSGISFMIELVPHDELVSEIDEIKEYSLSHFGALCHVTVARNENTSGFELLSKYTMKEYKEIWKQFDSTFFDFKCSTFSVKRREFCYAGDWSFTVDLETGTYRKCTYEPILGNIYANIDEPLHFEAVGHRCSIEHCYNSHAFLAVGCIPDVSAPTIAELRNRKTIDGSEWLTDDFKTFTSQKLYDGNEQYTWLKKWKVDHDYYGLRSYLSHFRFYQKLHEIKHSFNNK